MGSGSFRKKNRRTPGVLDNRGDNEWEKANIRADRNKKTGID